MITYDNLNIFSDLDERAKEIVILKIENAVLKEERDKLLTENEYLKNWALMELSCK